MLEQFHITTVSIESQGYVWQNRKMKIGLSEEIDHCEEFYSYSGSSVRGYELEVTSAKPLSQ